MKFSTLQNQLLRGGFAAIWMGATILFFYNIIPLFAAPTTNLSEVRRCGVCLIMFLIAWAAHMHLLMKAKAEKENE